MSAPAPPPLPPTAAFGQARVNVPTSLAADRSQLLIDIEKGAKLRSVNVSNRTNVPFPTKSEVQKMCDDPLKTTKNRLQAELSSTLQRRKNAHKIIGDSKEEDAENSIINHKNPNFVVPKNSTIKAIRKQTEELRSMSNTTKERQQKNDINDIDTLSDMISKLPQGEAILNEINKSMQHLRQATNEKQTEKLMIRHGKPNFTINPVKTSKVTVNKEKSLSQLSTENYSLAIERLKPVDHPDIAKKAESENSKAGELQMKFNSKRQFNENDIKTNSTNSPQQNTNHHSTFISPRKSQPFKQEKTILSPHMTPSTTIHHLNGGKTTTAVNFDTKPVTISFSKDLGAVPNRYPDTVKVCKPTQVESKNTFLTNVKFIIGSNGEVSLQK